MAAKFSKDFGFVKLTRDRKGRYKTRFRHPVTGKDVRRTLPVSTQGEAEAIAFEQNRQAYTGRGYIPSAKDRNGDSLSLADALAESIRRTRSRDATRRKYDNGANQFIAFIEKQFPRVQVWSQLRPSMLTSYVQAMHEENLAHDTIRNALVPVKRACAYWAAEQPELYRDCALAAGNGLRLAPSEKRRITTLEPLEVETLLAWLKTNRPRLYPIGVLQAMAGLRGYEAAFVRYCDVDWERGTITIAESEYHVPKSLSSRRTIPLTVRTVRILREYLDDAKIQPMVNEPIFLHSKGRPWRESSISDAWKRAFAEARRDLPWLGDFTNRKFRATFATIARRGKADVRILKSYLGHSLADVLGTSYENIGVEDMRRDVVPAFEKGLLLESAPAANDSRVASP